MPGLGIHREIAALVKAGLTPADAIRAATTNAAELLGAAKTLGAIAPGFGADFIVVTGDPLASVADLAKILHVVRRGEVLDPKDLLARARR
jgi:imidazolonepropionase-like amidohydrolase